VAKRVIELDRIHPGGMLDVPGRYSRFLEKKDEQLAGQASYRDSLRNRVRGELDWLSRKARARTRKSKARIDEAGRLQDELADLVLRSQRREVGIDFTATERRTRRLLVAEGVGRGFGERAIVSGLDLVLSPGHRLGLLGANGSGKTTLLRVLAGLDPPDTGTLQHAPGLQVVVFDQHRSRLEPAVSLRRSLAPAGDSVVYGGRPIHVAAWAQRFLFRADQLETPVGQLSGGEQARVLIARLVLEPADLLLLDEPTNDLDIPTLEVLEESLLEFPGALVLVTHDRYLLDRISNRLLALDGRGGARFFADYPQWEANRAVEAQNAAETAKAPASAAARKGPAPVQTKRLSWREQREWEQMEHRILEAEAALEEYERAAADPRIASDHVALSERAGALARAQAEVEGLYARWAELEARLKE
jgi:ATP-binding cassette subfamily F protein uup